MKDDLATHLAQQARLLGLDALNAAEAKPDTVRAFAQAVLDELAALGLVAGEEDVGCWAQRRVTGN
ncbi:hypothetical protein V3W47_00940 [Deinococcus sp. YIM 134068]|uniref:hypothetical protein n=1 Tax=Deinococcus lichenicola TaxID=3118910 RepID=UPI002F93EDBF